CDESAVRVLCEAGGEAIVSLAEAGVEFDTDPTGSWSRGMEGAHSHRRIFHSGGDATGRAIGAALRDCLRAEAGTAQHAEAGTGRVRVLERTMLLDLVAETSGERGESASEPGPQERVTGITVLRDGRIEHLAADAIVLATGAAGQVFAPTTNPAAATGDGLGAALRAGATVRDRELC